MDNGWRRVRVVGPTGAVILSLPTSRTVADLVAELLATLLPGAPLGRVAGGWHLHRVGQPAMAPNGGLLDGRVVDGDVLHLTAASAPVQDELVDDALDVLAEEAAEVGQWTAVAGAWVVAVGVVGCAAAAAWLCLLGRSLPWLGATALLALTLQAAAALAGSRFVTGPSGRSVLPVPHEPGHPGGASGGVRAGLPAVSEVLALAALPPWLCTAASCARAVGMGTAAAGTLAGLALAWTALVGTAVAPRMRACWAFLGAVGIFPGLAAATVAVGVLPSGAAAATSGCLALLTAGALPHLAVRVGHWSVPSAAGVVELRTRARSTRTLLTAVTAASSASVAGSAVVLLTVDSTASAGAASSGAGAARALCAALALGLILQSRRSMFVVECLSQLAGAVTIVCVLVGGLILRGGDAARLAPLGGLLAMLPALTYWLITLGHPQTGRLARPLASRVRGILDSLDAVAAASLLPLLAGFLGFYDIAANAASRL